MFSMTDTVEGVSLGCSKTAENPMGVSGNDLLLWVANVGRVESLRKCVLARLKMGRQSLVDMARIGAVEALNQSMVSLHLRSP